MKMFEVVEMFEEVRMPEEVELKTVEGVEGVKRSEYETGWPLGKIVKVMLV